VQGDGIDVVQIDHNKPETLKKALIDVDKLFFVRPESPNAIGHATNIVTKAKNAGIGHIVKLSALGAE
jgi:uncharacterized protein YbjT (DUF2867 family)